MDSGTVLLALKITKEIKQQTTGLQATCCRVILLILKEISSIMRKAKLVEIFAYVYSMINLSHGEHALYYQLKSYCSTYCATSDIDVSGFSDIRSVVISEAVGSWHFLDAPF